MGRRVRAGASTCDKGRLPSDLKFSFRKCDSSKSSCLSLAFHHVFVTIIEFPADYPSAAGVPARTNTRKGWTIPHWEFTAFTCFVTEPQHLSLCMSVMASFPLPFSPPEGTCVVLN